MGILRRPPLVRAQTLAFPAGAAPGFDPTHPASPLVIPGNALSVVPRQTRLFEILTAKISPGLAASTVGLDAIMGPVIVRTDGETGESFAGYPTTVFTSYTAATILKFSALTNFNNLTLVTNISGGSWFSELLTSQIAIGNTAGTRTFSNFTPVIGTQYFFAVSANGAQANFVSVNLTNGKTIAQTVSSALVNTGASQTTWGLQTGAAGGSYSAMMLSTAYLSLQQLLLWAADPWSFWYPRQKSTFLFTNPTTKPVIVRRPIKKTSPLAFPSDRPPGFDPTHIGCLSLTHGFGLSVVPGSGNSFIDLIGGKKGATSGTATNITRNIWGTLGQTNGFVAANSNAINFAGFPATTDTSMTAAAIFYSAAPTATVASPFIGNSTAAATGQFFGYNSTPVMIGYVVGVGGTPLSNLTITANTPYFAIWSCNGTTLNGLLLNLITGKVLTQSVADANAVPASNGTYGVGGNSGNSNFGTVNVAAAMLSPGYFMSIPVMTEWAADPWSFWYPNPKGNFFFNVPSAAITAFLINLASGNYSLTDEQQKLLRTALDGIQSGTYSLTDEQLQILKGSKSSVYVGNYSLTGENVTELKASKLFPQETAFSFTPENEALLKKSIQNIRDGTYALTDESLSLSHGYKALAQAGFYNLTGEQLTQKKTSLLNSQMTPYALTDESQKLLKTSAMTVPAGYYAVNNLDAARSLNGTSDYIGSLPNGFFNFSASYKGTFCCWFKVSGTSQGILFQTIPGVTPGGTGPTSFVPAMYIGSDGKLYVSIFWHGAATQISSSANAFNDGNWHQFVDTYDGTTETAYVDGTSIGSQTVGQTDYNAGSYIYFLGVVWNSAFWPVLANNAWTYGAVSFADIAFFNGTVLTAGNIASLAAGARANTVGTPSAYLPIVGRSPEPDYSGNGNSGPLNGTTVVSGPPLFAKFEAETLLKGSLTKGQAGSYSLAGENSTLLWKHLLNAQMTPYSLTGESLTLSIPAAAAVTVATAFLMGMGPFAGNAFAQFASQVSVTGVFTMHLNTGFYTLTGENLTELVKHLNNVFAGFYTFTVENETTLAGHAVKTQTGFYNLTGENATLLAKRLAGIQSGFYSLTGENETLLKKSRDNLQTGFYNLTGENEALSAGRKAFPQAGFYNLTGENLTLLDKRLAGIQTVFYNLTGESLTFTFSGQTQFTIFLGAGTYALTDNNLVLLKTSRDNLQVGTYALTDEQLALLKGSKLANSSGTYSLTDETITLKAGHLINPQAGFYTFSSALSMRRAALMGTAAGFYTVAGGNPGLVLVNPSLAIFTSPLLLGTDTTPGLSGVNASGTLLGIDATGMVSGSEANPTLLGTDVVPTVQGKV